MRVAAGREVVVMFGAALMTMLKSFSFVCINESITRTRKLNVPAEVGVPLSKPASTLSVKLVPGGRVPLTKDQVYGVVPPLAMVARLIDAPTVPGDSGEAVVMTKGTEMVTVYARPLPPGSPKNSFAFAPQRSRARIAKLKVPAVVGVPLITPVLEFRERPGGSDPGLHGSVVLVHAENVNGVVPPVTFIGCE